MRSFAFFAANYGYTRAQFYDLTRAEMLFLMKAYEDKVVSDSEVMSGAVGIAIANALRKKGRKAKKLWHKKPKKGDIEERKGLMRSAEKIDEKNGTSWIDRVYAANGRKRKPKKTGDGKK